MDVCCLLAVLTMVGFNDGWRLQRAGEFAWCTYDYLGEGEHSGVKKRNYWPARRLFRGSLVAIVRTGTGEPSIHPVRLPDIRVGR